MQITWLWLFDAGHVCSGLVAEQKGHFVGLAHFHGMPSSLRGRMIGFFEDLFVVPDHRSGGMMVPLPKAVQTEAKA